jgi:hypothetical protein
MMTIETRRRGQALGAAALTIAATIAVLPADIAAQRNVVRNTTRTNVNRNYNHDVNVNRNVNRNVNVDRDIDVDVDRHGGWGYHPVATGVAGSTAAAVTAAAVGSVVHALPPACSAVLVGTVTYQNCGGVWYQPQFYGTQVSYAVVTAPR